MKRDLIIRYCKNELLSGLKGAGIKYDVSYDKVISHLCFDKGSTKTFAHQCLNDLECLGLIEFEVVEGQKCIIITKKGLDTIQKLEQNKMQQALEVLK